MNPRVKTWHGRINALTGKVSVHSDEVGYLLDAATGQPANMTNAEAMRAAQFLASVEPTNNKVVERVS